MFLGEGEITSRAGECASALVRGLAYDGRMSETPNAPGVNGVPADGLDSIEAAIAARIAGPRYEDDPESTLAIAFVPDTEQDAVAAAGAVGFGPFALELPWDEATEFGGVSGLIQPLEVDGQPAHTLTESEKIGIVHRGAWDGVREVDPETGFPATRGYED